MDAGHSFFQATSEIVKNIQVYQVIKSSSHQVGIFRNSGNDLMTFELLDFMPTRRIHAA